jgi:hypothetical protein
MITNINRSVKDYDPSIKVVVAGYSDYKRINSISPFLLPEIGSKAGVDVVMVDTGIKDGRSTFEFMSEEELIRFTHSIRELGLESALAGSLKFEDLPVLKRIQPDIIGVRGMVCGGNRNSCIQQELVEKLRIQI